MAPVDHFRFYMYEGASHLFKIGICAYLFDAGYRTIEVISSGELDYSNFTTFLANDLLSPLTKAAYINILNTALRHNQQTSEADSPCLHKSSFKQIFCSGLYKAHLLTTGLNFLQTLAEPTPSHILRTVAIALPTIIFYKESKEDTPQVCLRPPSLEKIETVENKTPSVPSMPHAATYTAATSFSSPPKKFIPPYEMKKIVREHVASSKNPEMKIKAAMEELLEQEVSWKRVDCEIKRWKDN